MVTDGTPDPKAAKHTKGQDPSIENTKKRQTIEIDTQVSYMLVSSFTRCEISNSHVQENRRKDKKFLQRNEIHKKQTGNLRNEIRNIIVST